MLNKVEDIFADNRLFSHLQSKVKEGKTYDKDLYNKIVSYTNSYLNKYHTSDSEKAYLDFIKSYNKDMKRFAKSGKYPFQLDEKPRTLARFDYDIVLLFSCLLAYHRFRIMQLLTLNVDKIASGLFIGCGPGLEIELLKSSIGDIIAYDFDLNNFTVNAHPNVVFKEEYFNGENVDQKFDSIYLIEILEHLDEPYMLLEQCKKVLNEKGKIYLTTATNIPQFDHLYNFEASHSEFEEKLNALNFRIDLKEEIVHGTLTMDVQAKNIFYIISPSDDLN